MRFLEYAEKLEAIKYLAERKRTGVPRYLAKKLDVSVRTFQRMVQQLRLQGFPIVFNRKRGCYEVKEHKK